MVRIVSHVVDVRDVVRILRILNHKLVELGLLEQLGGFRGQGLQFYRHGSV